jgi:hypothetical protein
MGAVVGLIMLTAGVRLAAAQSIQQGEIASSAAPKSAEPVRPLPPASAPGGFFGDLCLAPHGTGLQAGYVADFGLRSFLRVDAAFDEQSDVVYAPRAADAVFSAGVGLVGPRSEHFVVAPSLMVQRTNRNDNGTSLLLLFPFDWTLDSGLRVGLDAGLGWNFNGVHCSDVVDEVCDAWAKKDAVPTGMLGVRAGWGERKGTLRESRAAEHPPAAVLSLDGMVGVIADAKSWESWTTGVQLGARLPYHLRTALRAERPGPDKDDASRTPGVPMPRVAFTGLVGYAVLDRPNLVLAPSVGFMATDQRNLGYLAELALPVIYQAESGLEFGAEAGIGRAFAGKQRIDPCTIPHEPCTEDGTSLVTRDVRSDWGGSFGVYLGYALPIGA